jgi:hypothetical protein
LIDDPDAVAADVIFEFSGLLSGDRISELEGYRLFSFARDDDKNGATVADGIVLRQQHLRPFILPRGLYPTLTDKAVLTLAIRSVLVAREDLDRALAYDVSKALLSRVREIALSYPLVTSELTDQIDGGDLMLPLHNGMKRYLARDAPGFVERYIEILAFAFTVAVTFLSSAYAFFRYRAQVRKDRIDGYYAQVLNARNELSEDVTASALEERRETVQKLQSEVLDLLARERIDANISLFAFLSISNQVINELDRRVRATRSTSDCD